MTRDEFWPYYVSQHLDPVNRALHFAGTTVGLFLLGCALAFPSRRLYFLPMGLLGSYGLAWTGHFFFERNSPATFRYPLLSFLADFRMYALMWRGECAREVERLGLTAR